MKTFTSVLSVNRLLTSLFTLSILLLASNAIALNETVYNTNNTTVSSGIEYKSINASASEKSVVINWVTASEQNNSHFEVERSTNMKDFKTVAMVLDGFAAEGTGKTYRFKEDAGAVRKGKTVYYRLKQVDSDNQVHYSSVMAVNMNATVVGYPKQADEQVKLNNSGATSNTLLSKQSTIIKGFTNIPVELATASSAGIFDTRIVMSETELNYPKLVFA